MGNIRELTVGVKFRRPCGVSENGGYRGCGVLVVDMATT